eukprot:5239409-Prymnesium_polylepis.1
MSALRAGWGARRSKSHRPVDRSWMENSVNRRSDERPRLTNHPPDHQPRGPRRPVRLRASDLRPPARSTSTVHADPDRAQGWV